MIHGVSSSDKSEERNFVNTPDEFFWFKTCFHQPHCVADTNFADVVVPDLDVSVQEPFESTQIFYVSQASASGKDTDL